MSEKQLKQKLITTCTSTFEAFDYSCSFPSGLGSLWEMIATKFNGDKSYAIVCAPRLDAVRNNIRIAQKKLGEGTRLVVVTHDFTQEEMDASVENNYGLVSIEEMERFGLEIVEIKQRDRGRELSDEELTALSSTREKIF